MGKDFRGGRGGKPTFNRNSMRGGHGGQKRGGLGSGARGKAKVIVTPHRFEGVFTYSSGKDESLVTLSFAPGQVVYGEKIITVEDKNKNEDGQAAKIEYRVWNVFRSKLGACIVNGIGEIYMKPGSKVLYIGGASGTTISHVSDIVGADGVVYGIEISERSGRELTNMAKKRPNIIPIIEDGRKPWKYRMMLSMCDVIFADVAQPDQARIIDINAQYFLKEGGGFVFSIKANCIDSTVAAEVVFQNQIDALKAAGFRVREKVTLEPYERDHCVVTGVYKPYKKNKNNE